MKNNILKIMGLAITAIIVFVSMPANETKAASFVNVNMNPQGKGIITVKHNDVTLGEYDYNTTISLDEEEYYALSTRNLDTGYGVWGWNVTGNAQITWGGGAGQNVQVYVYGACTITCNVGVGEPPPSTGFVAGNRLLHVEKIVMDEYGLNIPGDAGGYITGDLDGVTPYLTTTGLKNYLVGDCNLALEAVTNAGYGFLFWKIMGENVSVEGSVNNFYGTVVYNEEIIAEIEEDGSDSVLLQAIFYEIGSMPVIPDNFQVKYESRVVDEGYSISPPIGKTIGVWEDLMTETVSVAAPDYENYYFKGWYVNGSLKTRNKEASLIMASLYNEVEARWGIKGEGDIITVEVVGDGIIYPNVNSFGDICNYYDLWFEDARNINFKAIAGSGAYFDYWDADLADGYEDWQDEISLVSGSQKITAYFTSIPPEYESFELTLEAVPGDGGSIQINGVGVSTITVEPYETVTVTAVPEEGYVFAGWFGQDINGSKNIEETFTVVDMDKVRAFFLIDPNYEHDDPPLPTTTVDVGEYETRIKILVESQFDSAWYQLVKIKVNGESQPLAAATDAETGVKYLFSIDEQGSRIDLTAVKSFRLSDYYSIPESQDEEYVFSHWAGDIIMKRDVNNTVYAVKDRVIEAVYSKKNDMGGGPIIGVDEGVSGLFSPAIMWFQGFGMDLGIIYWILLFSGMGLLFYVFRESTIIRVVMPLGLLGLGLMVGWVDVWVVALIALGAGVVVYMVSRKMLVGE